MPELDVEFCRSHFPVLSTSWALFDNAGGAVTPAFVSDRVADYMRTCMVQSGASYPLSRRATDNLAEAHATAAALMGAPNDAVVLAHSTTAAAQTLSNAVNDWVDGGTIVVSEAEHESNLHPWRMLAERGAKLRTWPLDPETALLRLDALDELLDGEVRLVCMTHCSNVVGAIHDVRAVAERVHAAGARLCVDGVAYAPHRRLRVEDWDVDYYLCSLYKVYGPHIAAWYGKPEYLLEAKGQYNSVIPETAIPYKLEPGNPTHELAAGIPGIVDYLAAVHDRHFDDCEVETKLDRTFDLFADHEAKLVAPLLEFLAEHPKTTLVGPADSSREVRVPTVAFTVEGTNAFEIPPRLEAHEIAIRAGDFHARAPVRALGLLDKGGVVRVSLVHYNTPAEVARLIDALNGLL